MDWIISTGLKGRDSREYMRVLGLAKHNGSQNTSNPSLIPGSSGLVSEAGEAGRQALTVSLDVAKDYGCTRVVENKPN